MNEIQVIKIQSKLYIKIADQLIQDARKLLLKKGK